MDPSTPLRTFVLVQSSNLEVAATEPTPPVKEPLALERTLLTKGVATRSKKLLGAPGRTRSKDASLLLVFGLLQLAGTSLYGYVLPPGALQYPQASIYLSQKC